MNQDVQNIAVIGAGISGVLSAWHLKAAGLGVTVYERSSQAGGVWLFDDRLPVEPKWPSVKPSEADFALADDVHEPVQWNEELNCKRNDNDLAKLLHAPPGPCYEGLKNNVSTPLLKVKNRPWKPGTADFVNHQFINEYIQDIARDKVIESCFLYNTRVERVWKQDGKWNVQSKTLIDLGSGALKYSKQTHQFGAVVVASGHYHACKIPDIPGLQRWKTLWPDRIEHSKGYRRPDKYENQNILLIGAATSSTDIAREIGPAANKIFQVSRGGAFDIPAELLPDNVTRIGSIKSFDGDYSTLNHRSQLNGVSVPLQTPPASPLTPSTPLPGTITLTDSTPLPPIHRIILCTGYQFSLPFLSHLHRDSLLPTSADPYSLVTDGTQMHNLHKDIFYIPDPTLSFVGVPFYTATFTLFEFQAITMAAVYSGRADLPSEKVMREEYEKRVQRKGYGRSFHNLRDQEEGYVNELVAWVNEKGGEGVERVEGHTEEWRLARAKLKEMIRKRIEEGSRKVKNNVASG